MTDWLIIHHDGQTHVWELGTVDADRCGDLAVRARKLIGMPADDSAPVGAVSVAPGEPHPRLLARAIVHDMSELDAVSSADVDAYTASLVQAAAAERQRAARAAAAGLTPAERSALAEELIRTPTPPPRAAPGAHTSS